MPKHDIDAKGLVRLSLLITIVISIISGLLVILLDEKIIEIFQLKEIAPYIFLIPIVILLAGFLQVMEQWLIRTKQF